MNIEDLKTLIKNGEFRSPTKGAVGFHNITKELMSYMNDDSESDYKIVIGTDSERRETGADFVSVVAIHRIRKGGRYFWLRSYDKKDLDLRNRIYKEATMSLALAQVLLEQELESNHISIFNNALEIHVDIGINGPTREMIKQISGMIRGSGFYVKIKPEAFAAATVADKHL